LKALLLSAGYGTRLRPITDHVPKCLVNIQGKPLLAYWLETLLPNGIERVLINKHYLPDAVDTFVKQSNWVNKIDMVYEPMLLGTGGTVLRNLNYFSDGPFMVAHADNLTRFEVDKFIDAHKNRASGTEITMMTFKTDAPQSCGIVELDYRGVVQQFHEKVANPLGNLANAAVYIFEPTVINFLAELGQDVIDISIEVLPAYLGRIQTFLNDDYHRDIGTPESLALAELEF
jgi:mannose-1-phosphate guanylyltransferase